MDARGRRWTAAVFLLAVGILLWPAARWAWGVWWRDPLYSHGPVVVLVSLFVSWRLSARRPPVEARSSAWSLVLLGASLAAMSWSLVAQAFYLTLLSSLVLIAGATWFMYGGDTLRRYAFPIVYLLLAIPLPFVERLSVPLQRWTVGVSTVLARVLGVSAVHLGGRVILSTCELTVGAPCSGLNSLVALLAVAALMAFLLRGRWWARGALIAVSVPMAVVVNTLRVLVLLLVAARCGREVALGFWHEWSGALSFGLAVALLTATGGWLGCRSVRGDI